MAHETNNRLAILVLNLPDEPAPVEQQNRPGQPLTRPIFPDHFARNSQILDIGPEIEPILPSGPGATKSASQHSMRFETLNDAIGHLTDYQGHCLLISPHVLPPSTQSVALLAEMAAISEYDVTLLLEPSIHAHPWDPRIEVQRDAKGRFQSLADPLYSDDCSRHEGDGEICAKCMMMTIEQLQELNRANLGSSWLKIFEFVKTLAGNGGRIGTCHSRIQSYDCTGRISDTCHQCGADYEVSENTGILLVRDTAVLAVDDPGFNSGQLTIFPKRHVSSFLSLRGNENRDISRLIQTGESALKEIYHYDALNLGFNSGDGAHLKVRLIPRWVGDLNFMPLVSGLKPVPDSPRAAWSRLNEVIR
jgi:ATP adenylyltransferase